MMTLEEMKQMERIRTAYGVQSQAAEAEALKRMKSAPLLTAEDSTEIERMLSDIRRHNQFTFDYNEGRNGLGNGQGITHFEQANAESMRLKKSIYRMLDKYKYFYQEHPDPNTLGIRKTHKKYNYYNIDPKVIKIERTVEELRAFGEEEMYQLKKRQVNIKSLLDFTDADLGNHPKLNY